MLLGRLWRSSREGVHWGFVERVLEMLAQLAVDGSKLAKRTPNGAYTPDNCIHMCRIVHTI